MVVVMMIPLYCFQPFTFGLDCFGVIIWAWAREDMLLSVLCAVFPGLCIQT